MELTTIEVNMEYTHVLVRTMEYNMEYIMECT